MTGPDDIRARFAGHATGALVAELAALRPRPGSMVRYHTLLSLRELGSRAPFPDAQLERLNELIVPLVATRAPGLLALHGVGPYTAAMLLVAAGMARLHAMIGEQLGEDAETAEVRVGIETGRGL